MSFEQIDSSIAGRPPKFKAGDGLLIVGGHKCMIVDEPVYGYPPGGGQCRWYYPVVSNSFSSEDKIHYVSEFEITRQEMKDNVN